MIFMKWVPGSRFSVLCSLFSVLRSIYREQRAELVPIYRESREQRAELVPIYRER